jgi:hypothetical protein
VLGLIYAVERCLRKVGAPLLCGVQQIATVCEMVLVGMLMIMPGCVKEKPMSQ